MAKRTIVRLGCFDTKGEPYSWFRDRIASKGIGTLLLDNRVAGGDTKSLRLRETGSRMIFKNVEATEPLFVTVEFLDSDPLIGVSSRPVD